MSTRFTEVRCDFFDENKGWWCVDAWETSDPNEDGKVVATIKEDTLEVTYACEEYKEDELIQEVIKEKLHEITE